MTIDERIRDVIAPNHRRKGAPGHDLGPEGIWGGGNRPGASIGERSASPPSLRDHKRDQQDQATGMHKLDVIDDLKCYFHVVFLFIRRPKTPSRSHIPR